MNPAAHLLNLHFKLFVVSLDHVIYPLDLGGYQSAELLREGVILSHDEVLDSGHEAQPLGVVLVFYALALGVDDEGVVFVQEVEGFEDEEAFAVELASVPVLVQGFLSHDQFVTLRDNGDQEVQQDNQNDPLVKEPDKPNDDDHQSYQALIILINGEKRVPFFMARRSEISN